MSEINFNNKTFYLLENSENGQVNSETIFEYKQEGNLVTAEYYGGNFLYGKIIAVLEGNYLNMLYQCVTKESEMMAGKAKALISFNEYNKIKLALNWEWLGDEKAKGTSVYIEK
ncbi:MAG: n-acetylglutamate synthase [Bacteroidia bacterium]